MYDPSAPPPSYNEAIAISEQDNQNLPKKQNDWTPVSVAAVHNNSSIETHYTQNQPFNYAGQQFPPPAPAPAPVPAPVPAPALITNLYSSGNTINEIYPQPGSVAEWDPRAHLLQGYPLQCPPGTEKLCSLQEVTLIKDNSICSLTHSYIVLDEHKLPFLNGQNRLPICSCTIHPNPFTINDDNGIRIINIDTTVRPYRVYSPPETLIGHIIYKIQYCSRYIKIIRTDSNLVAKIQLIQRREFDRHYFQVQSDNGVSFKDIKLSVECCTCSPKLKMTFPNNMDYIDKLLYFSSLFLLSYHIDRHK